MAQAGNDGQGGPAGQPTPPPAAPAAAQPSLAVVAQYVKDLSFENPGAPVTLAPRQKAPNINIGINVMPRSAGENQYEVELKIEARAVDGDTVIFALELVFAGLFRLLNVPPQDLAPLTLIECPRLLFPFARQIVSNAVQNGGFPPLLIDPVDFVGLYRQRVAAEQQRASAQQQPAGNA